MKEINNVFVILLTGLLLAASPVLAMSGGGYVKVPVSSSAGVVDLEPLTK